jgi:putative endopeptidase
MLEDCLDNPDTPEKANIAAFLSTYMDQEARESSMTYIQPMVDAIWNAPDFASLTDICADICRETGIEILLNTNNWADWYDIYFYDEGDGHLTQGFSLGYYQGEKYEDFAKGTFNYEAFMEQTVRLLLYLGFDRDVAESACRNWLEGPRRMGIIAYEDSALPKQSAWIIPEDDSEEFPDFPFKSYLERAGFNYKEKVHLDNCATFAVAIEMMMKEEYLPGTKIILIKRLIDALSSVVPAHIRDAIVGYWGDVYAAYPSMIFDDDDMSYYLLPLVQTDTFIYYSKTDEYPVLHERLEGICQRIMAFYRKMLENESWLSEETRSTAIDKLDNMKMMLLIPEDMSGLFTVQYKSADEGGTLFENVTNYIKARRQWLSEHSTGYDLSFIWSIYNNWLYTYYYMGTSNTFFLNLNGFVGSHVKADSSNEEIMGNLGFLIAHEISHAFGHGGSFYDKDGNKGDWWTPEDRTQFNERCEHLGEFMCGYEYFPGYAINNWKQVVDESVADQTAMKCIMSIAAQIPDFDYAECFASFANLFADSSTRRGIDDYLVPDEHAPGRCRVNRILSLTEEFYRTFDIKPGDGMYVAPEDRPVVW